MEEALLSYRYNDAASLSYEYFWNDFCDWYVEATKLSMKAAEDSAEAGKEKDRATTVRLTALAAALRLLHPLLPFVTEEIYDKLPNVEQGRLLIHAPYPEYKEELVNEAAEKAFGFLQELVRMVRTLRSECTVSPEKKIRLLVRLPGSAGQTAFLRENAELVKLLAGIGELEIREDAGGEAKPAGFIGLAGAGFEAFVYIAEAVDPLVLKQKFTKELERDKKYAAGLKSKLDNEKFLQNAPPELVEGEKAKLDEALKRTGKIESWLKDMG
jgi:valyl-tRNA synthetase